MNGVLNKTYTDHSRFQIGMVLFFALVVLRNVFLLPIPVAVILLLNACLIFFGSKEEIVALFVCYIPLEASFQFKYGILLCALFYLIKSRFRFKVAGNQYGLLILAMVIWELLHFVIGDFSVNEYLRSVAELAFLFIIVMDKNEFDFPFIARCLIVTTCFVGTAMLANLLIKYQFDFVSLFLLQHYRLGVINENIGIANLNYNANQLGYIFCLSILTELILITKYKPTARQYVVLFYLIFLGLLTKSRSFFVCLIFTLILFILFQSNKNRSLKTRRILAVILLLLVFLILINVFAADIINQYIERFSSDDVSNSRNTIFLDYHRLLSNGALVRWFGLGTQNLFGNIVRHYDIQMIQVPHNGLQEVAVMWGIPGLVLFLLFLAGMIHFDMVKKEKLLHLSVLLLTLFSSMFGQLITNSTKLMALTFILVLMRYRFKEKTE